MVFGLAWQAWRLYTWERQEPRIAKGLCRAGETFTETRKRTFGSPRVVYNYVCVDTVTGRQRILTGELLALSPQRRLGFWAPLVGGLLCFVGGLLLTAAAVPRSRRGA